MQHNDSNHDEQWEDIVRRLGGPDGQTPFEPISEESPLPVSDSSPLPSAGPRDYTVAEEIVEDFRPPVPKPIASGNPRTVLSWSGVIGATVIWILAALLGWQLPWWMSWLTGLSLLAGAVSLFFLLPKTWAHRDPFDNDDYGDGAKV